ncbi:hypothetical protein ACS0TY_000155 [Phlomoides rotata]
MEDSYDERYDFDGAERSLESFVIQLFEFLLPVVRSPTFVKVVIHNVKELVYYTIGFLQMAEQQYVADEDDNTYSCRVSGTLESVNQLTASFLPQLLVQAHYYLQRYRTTVGWKE